jgi:hypothetical protein
VADEADTADLFGKGPRTRDHKRARPRRRGGAPAGPAVDPLELRLAEQRLADGQERLRRMREELQAAERERDQQSQGISEYDLLPLWNRSHDEALRGREQAQDDAARAGRAAQEPRTGWPPRSADARPGGVRGGRGGRGGGPAGGRPAAQAGPLIEETIEHLVAARAAAHGKIAEGIETRLREYLPRSPTTCTTSSTSMTSCGCGSATPTSR